MSKRHKPVGPIPDTHNRMKPSPGMTLHEHYAGLAMQALIAGVGRHFIDSNAADYAKAAIHAADALIEELDKK